MTESMFDRVRPTENKRRVITLLSRHGTLSKRQLTERGKMGWATSVKVISQLQEAGIIRRAGTSSKKPDQKGKNAYVFELRKDRPLALGIDVEYRVTNVILTNLAGDVLAQERRVTPMDADEESAAAFLESVIADFLAEHVRRVEDLDGVGIGLPGIGFPTRSRLDNIEKARQLQGRLEERFGIRARILTNTHAYAVYEKWDSETFALPDFLFISIRTGVGSGIFYSGRLYTGTHGLAGELGHVRVVEGGRDCRCGRSGCLETVVNERSLYDQYARSVLGKGPSELTERVTQVVVRDGIADLFSRAGRGEPEAVSIVESAGEYLGRCLAYAVAVLDITNIIVSGHFGPDGGAIVPVLERHVRQGILPKMDCHIRYVPFDPSGHTRGAALLVFKDYFTEVERQSDASGPDNP